MTNKSKWCGKSMKSRRLELKLTLEKLGKSVGTTKSYIWEIEHGCQPSVGLAHDISKMLKKPIDCFVK